MEHKEAVGDLYGRGDASRIMIVGYSHHAELDHEEITLQTVASAKAGEMQRFPFFARLPTYLDMERGAFWDSVVFLNFVPSAIGAAGKRYAWAPREMHQKGFERLKKLIARYKPTHVFIMTSKPDADHYAPFRIRDLGPYREEVFEADGREFRVLNATIDGHATRLAVLPHPQGARTAQMRLAFAHALSAG